jgi:hypothetical protein
MKIKKHFYFNILHSEVRDNFINRHRKKNETLFINIITFELGDGKSTWSCFSSVQLFFVVFSEEA